MEKRLCRYISLPADLERCSHHSGSSRQGRHALTTLLPAKHCRGRARGGVKENHGARVTLLSLAPPRQLSLHVELGRAVWSSKASSPGQNINPPGCSSTAHSITLEHLCRILFEGGTQSPSAATCLQAVTQAAWQAEHGSLPIACCSRICLCVCSCSVPLPWESRLKLHPCRARSGLAAQPLCSPAGTVLRGARAPGNGPAGAASRIPSPPQCLPHILPPALRWG